MLAILLFLKKPQQILLIKYPNKGNTKLRQLLQKHKKPLSQIKRKSTKSHKKPLPKIKRSDLKLAYIEGITDQPNEYIRFIDSAPIKDSGKFVINKLDYPDSYISDYYTPNF